MGEKSKAKSAETIRQAEKARLVLNRCLSDRFVYITLVLPVGKARLEDPPNIVTNISRLQTVYEVLKWLVLNFSRYRLKPIGQDKANRKNDLPLRPH